jgi:hypothetical protein
MLLATASDPVMVVSSRFWSFSLVLDVRSHRRRDT